MSAHRKQVINARHTAARQAAEAIIMLRDTSDAEERNALACIAASAIAALASLGEKT